MELVPAIAAIPVVICGITLDDHFHSLIHSLLTRRPIVYTRSRCRRSAPSSSA